MTKTAKLLTPPTNYAVVQLPDRAFPGVVFQGDSLYIVSQKLSDARMQLEQDKTKEALEIISELALEFTGNLRHYEHVCSKNNIGIPYNK